MLGEGGEREQLERRAAERGVAAREHFAGRLPHAELPRWLAADSRRRPASADFYRKAKRAASQYSRALLASGSFPGTRRDSYRATIKSVRKSPLPAPDRSAGSFLSASRYLKNLDPYQIVSNAH